MIWYSTMTPFKNHIFIRSFICYLDTCSSVRQVRKWHCLHFANGSKLVSERFSVCLQIKPPINDRQIHRWVISSHAPSASHHTLPCYKREDEGPGILCPLDLCTWIRQHVRDFNWTIYELREWESPFFPSLLTF